MKLGKPLQISAIVLLVGALLFSFSGFRVNDTSRVEAGEPTLNHVIVSGEGVVKLKADTVEIILGAQADGATAQEAQIANAQLMAEVTSTLKEMLSSNDRWETVQISLYPLYDWSEDGEGKLIGFRAENTIRINLSQIGRAGEVIDACVKAGANLVQDIQFTIKDQSQAELQAIELAMQDAENKANTALKQVGKTITGIESISIGEVNSPQVPIRMIYQAAGVSASTPVEAGMLEVRATVSVTYTF